MPTKYVNVFQPASFGLFYNLSSRHTITLYRETAAAMQETSKASD
jgi:hypothetical protein